MLAYGGVMIMSIVFGLQLQENIFGDLFPKTLRGRKVAIKNNPGMLFFKIMQKACIWK